MSTFYEFAGPGPLQGQRTAVVTGGSGFLGSHLCRALAERGLHVLSVDGFVTANAQQRLGFDDVPYTGPEGLLELRRQTLTIDLAFDPTITWQALRTIEKQYDVESVWHFASPASPTEYKRDAIRTLALGSWVLDLIVRTIGADRFVFASSSEVYGDALQAGHPGRLGENLPGYVSSTGPRSMYDEAKRFGECYGRWLASEVGLSFASARIFNTYGPGMALGDGRVVSALMHSALTGEPFICHGTGEQTRSLCYVDDLIDQLLLVHDCVDNHEPGLVVNVGSGDEYSIRELAEIVQRQPWSKPFPILQGAPQDEHDPVRRCPSLGRLAGLGYRSEPVGLVEGLRRTYEWHSGRRAQARLFE